MQEPTENDVSGALWPHSEVLDTDVEKHVLDAETPDRFEECEKAQLISDAGEGESEENIVKSNEIVAEASVGSHKSRTPRFNLRLVNSRTQKSQKDAKSKDGHVENGLEKDKHVSFEGDGKYEHLEDAPKLEFVSDKARKFGRGSSSTDFFGHSSEEDDNESESVDTRVSGTTVNVQNDEVVAITSSSLEDNKTPYSILKSENHNRSFLKDKLTSSIRGKQSNVPVKGSEKSPLLGKHSPPSSVSSVNASLPRHSFKDEDSHHEQLSSPTRSFNSSEDDSQFHNLSEDTDQHPSPSIISDDGDGACNKYSQLSEHGSSTSSPLTSGDIDDRKQGNEDDRLLRENGADEGRKSGKREVAGLLENPLQLGTAFSPFVDVDKFRESLGQRSPRTEDNFGGRSEEHLLVLLKGGSNRNLKSYLRNSQWPAESNARHRLWENVCSNRFGKFQDNLYKEVSEELFENATDEDIELPPFVDPEHLHSYFLNASGILAVKKVMNVISRMSPDIIFCPLLYPMSSIFLHYMSPEACYNCMQALLGVNKASMFFLTQSKTKTEASKYVLLDLAKKYTKNAYVLIERSSKNQVAVFDNWMWWLFRDLPFHYSVSIIDSYLLEGYKVFYRMALAVIYLFTKDSNRRGSRSSPVQNINAAISRFCGNMQTDTKKFIKVGFGIRGLTRKEITKLHTKHEANLRNLPVSNDIRKVVSSPSMGQFLIPRAYKGQVSTDAGPSAVLTPEMMKLIWTWIPMRLTLMTPKLLFSSDEDGTALRTLYQKTERYPQTLMVIKTTNNEVFGAYCSVPWETRYEANKPHMSFFGTGETFVFTFQPAPIKYPWTGTLGDNAPVHPVDHFMAGDDTMLIVGSGNGEAIYLDTMMNRCSTTHCDTFDNDPLCSDHDFTCLIVQVFGFVD
ncbi:GTPase-activating protein skywalker-like [Biomphalaria glabrata]|uniref:GTPase-activating protein skywalker-like n=1 Tax=Biomphalaria glabrata TaxID=6526 RepID=A0A9W2Z1E5_BIOGL|nr:GTPase-activating protein skywalker-like [Biomphalaria glabrata]